MGFFGHDGIIEKTAVENPKWKPLPPRYKLNPCPECGATQEDGRIHVQYIGAVESGGWRVICADCLCLPDRLCETEEEAVNLWNGVEN